ncbi:MAG: arginyltransferase [Phycisphaerae bacterium]
MESQDKSEAVHVGEDFEVPLTEEFPCPYLPDRMSRSEVYSAEGLTPAMYEMLMAHGFRRSGSIIYRPVCRGCNECQQLRVPVGTFRLSRSMRRVWRRNEDVEVRVVDPQPSEGKYELFRRYLVHQHDGSMTRTYQAFVDFLYNSPMESTAFEYSVGGQLVAVSLADICADGLSSVYVYFDPDFRDRSLGVYSALWEIDFCRRENLAYYYLGFYIADCAAMNYKSRYAPNEVAVDDGRWVRFEE